MESKCKYIKSSSWEREYYGLQMQKCLVLLLIKRMQINVTT